MDPPAIEAKKDGHTWSKKRDPVRPAEHKSIVRSEAYAQPGSASVIKALQYLFQGRQPLRTE